MKTIKVKESDFQIWEYVLTVTCPHCKSKFCFYEYQKWIDKTDYCPKCGKEVHIVSEDK